MGIGTLADQDFIPWPQELKERYIAGGYWQDITLGDILRNTAARYPEREAFVDAGTRVTYAQLEQRANRLASGFLEMGIRKGDRVIVQLPNCIEFIYVFFALTKIGALGVLALRHHRGREIGYLAGMSEAVGIVAPTSSVALTISR